MRTSRAGRGGAPLGSEALDGRLVEERAEGAFLRLAEWEEEGVVCGITLAASGDFGVSGSRTPSLFERYSGLAGGLGFAVASVPLHVHGSDVVEVGGEGRAWAGGPGAALFMPGRADGQVTSARGWLLAATAADCVPVHLRHAGTGAIGLVHAGWRGVAAGILGKGLERLLRIARRADPAAGPSGVEVHLGPAICGACYEVDAPVLEALGKGGSRATVDLRGLLVEQAARAGAGAVTASSWCTRCAGGELHSHRGSGGRAGRMAAFLGIPEP